MLFEMRGAAVKWTSCRPALNEENPMSTLTENLKALAEFTAKHNLNDGFMAYATETAKSLTAFQSSTVISERKQFARRFKDANWRRVASGSSVNWLATIDGIAIELPYMEDLAPKGEKDLGPVVFPEKTAEEADSLSGFKK
jgi:hypothetical protein